MEIRYQDQEKGGLGTFMVANAVSMIRGAKHRDSAHKLIDYILSTATQRKLAFLQCAQTPLTPRVEEPSDGTVKRISSFE